MITLEFDAILDKESPSRQVCINAYTYCYHYAVSKNQCKVHLSDKSYLLVNHSYNEIKEKVWGTKRKTFPEQNFNKQFYNKSKEFI